MLDMKAIIWLENYLQVSVNCHSLYSELDQRRAVFDHSQSSAGSGLCIRQCKCALWFCSSEFA